VPELPVADVEQSQQHHGDRLGFQMGWLIPLVVAALALLPGSAARAHHGFYGEYSLDERIDFSGTVVGVEWINPHAFVDVRATIDGTESVFRIELPGLRQLNGRGWRGDELAVGTVVRIENAALQLIEGSTLICCARIFDLNGKEFYTDPRPGPAPLRSLQEEAAAGIER
jgi:hypothetical protein